MTGIYEISKPGVFAPTNRPPGCGVFHVSTQTTESFYNHAAVEVTADVALTPSTPTNLDGSDMVRMSWPEDDDVIGWILDPSWRVKKDYEIVFDESTPRSGRIEWAEHATQFHDRYQGIRTPVTTQDLYGIDPQLTIPDVIG